MKDIKQSEFLLIDGEPQMPEPPYTVWEQVAAALTGNYKRAVRRWEREYTLWEARQP